MPKPKPKPKPKDWRIHFKSNLRRDGWTMTQLARRSGVPLGTLSNWFSGKENRGEPDISDALKLARAMGLTLDALFCGEHDVDQVAAIVRETLARMRKQQQRAARQKPQDPGEQDPDPAA